jgi:hypothetical protein
MQLMITVCFVTCIALKWSVAYDVCLRFEIVILVTVKIAAFSDAVDVLVPCCPVYSLLHLSFQFIVILPFASSFL